MNSPVIYLMYHEIELAGRTTCETEPGYTRYVLSEREFRRQMSWLEAEAFQGVSVAEALKQTPRHNEKDRKPIAITFDDGCETDLIAAAPALKQSGFNATFYVIAGRLGKRGYLSERRLRELSDEGFEIGCHSMTHRYLPDLDEDALRVEVVEAKKRIEQIIGKRVANFSCPGGRWSAGVARLRPFSNPSPRCEPTWTTTPSASIAQATPTVWTSAARDFLRTSASVAATLIR